MDVRALAFDVFGTLVDWRSGIASAFRTSGVAGDPQQLADAWRERYWPMLIQFNEGARPWGNFDEQHEMTLDDLLKERRQNLSAEGKERDSLPRGMSFDPWPDVRSGLEALRGERTTAALSNGHIALLVDLARHGDLRFDCLLSAELAHAYKPAPEVYLTAARLLGLDPGAVMMVAAHPLDLAAARAAGLQSAFIDRPLEYGHGSPARADPEAAISVGDLNELAARLAAVAR